MEVVFCNLERFFTQEPQKAYRIRQYFPQKGNPVRNEAGQEQRRAAERKEIDHRAQEYGQKHKDAHLPSPGRNDEEEERGCDRQPEQEVQKRAQKGDAHPAPQETEEVVEKSAADPQHRRAQEYGQLSGEADLHQRNSRDKKPPRSPPSSS